MASHWLIRYRYVNAKDAQLNGDEEKAYVLYMHYYHVLKSIWKDSTYKKKKVCLYVYVCMYAYSDKEQNVLNKDLATKFPIAVTI